MSELTQVLGRIERAADGVAVVFERHYATGRDDLWQACTDPGRLVRWFAPVSGELRPGGEFTIHFGDGDTPLCRVVSCDAPERLVWEWPIGDVATLVTADIAADADGSRLVLRHASLTPGQVAGYAAGWDAYVRSLDAQVDGTEPPDWEAMWTALQARYAEAVHER